MLGFVIDPVLLSRRVDTMNWMFSIIIIIIIIIMQHKCSDGDSLPPSQLCLAGSSASLSKNRSHEQELRDNGESMRY